MRTIISLFFLSSLSLSYATEVTYERGEFHVNLVINKDEFSNTIDTSVAIDENVTIALDNCQLLSSGAELCSGWWRVSPISYENTYIVDLVLWKKSDSPIYHLDASIGRSDYERNSTSVSLSNGLNLTDTFKLSGDRQEITDRIRLEPVLRVGPAKAL